MKRIGLLGGTFNPIHTGHLAAAQAALEKLKLDQVIFIPCYLPPHKTGKGLLKAKTRSQLVKLAIAGNSKFSFSNHEITRKGKSYSIDTVDYFQKKFLYRAKLFFIIGADSQPQLARWKRIEELKKKVTFVMVNRPGQKTKKSRIKIRTVTMPGLEISSTDIRRRLQRKESIQYLVPEKVYRYIKKNRLYRST